LTLSGLGFDLGVFVAYLVNFTIILLVLRAFAFKPIMEMLERRKNEIATSLAAADEVKAQAEQERKKLKAELESSRESSQEEARKIAQATADMREQILEDARREAEVIKTKARADMENERQAMQAELHRQVADLTVELTRKVMQQSIDEKSHRKMVDQFLAEMGD
jgi:F-type H+-transporting ATPase subunit b